MTSKSVMESCPYRFKPETRKGCCTWDTFIGGVADYWPRWFSAPPTREQWAWALRDWKAGNTGFEAAHNAQRRIKDRDEREATAKAIGKSLIAITRRSSRPPTPKAPS